MAKDQKRHSQHKPTAASIMKAHKHVISKKKDEQRATKPSYQEICRAQCRMGKEILVHCDTLTCTFKGCIVCAYKVLVKPNGDYRQFKLNARPEECKRKVKTDVYTGNVLVVGDGDLTFSLDLSRQSNIQLTATTYLSLE